jgi:hypothetical protein
MEDPYRVVTSELHFSKWIVAPTKELALAKANTFWNAEETISVSTEAVVYQRAKDKSTSRQLMESIEWLVKASVVCRRDQTTAITARARSNSWKKEDQD